MFTSRTLIAVVVAGIAGTIANAVVVALLFGAPLLPLIFSFGRLAVAILVALLLPPLFAGMGRGAAAAAGFVALTIIPSILAKTVFAAGAPWGVVLGVNAVYAAVAVIVYVAMARPASRAA